jgi:aerobic-type carbon monoxide dehydrogenase small subunit (CoxS/CutS family)
LTKEKVTMDNDLRIKRGISRGQSFSIQVDGQTVNAYPGETLVAVMLASGQHMFRHTMLSGEPRGLFCGMGVCFDCLVTVNGRHNVRACQTFAQPGDIVERQKK